MKTRLTVLRIALAVMVLAAAGTGRGSDERVSTAGIAGLWWYQEIENPVDWVAGMVQVETDGTYAGEGYDPKGAMVPLSGRFVVQPDGKVYKPANRSFLGAVRPAMDVLVGNQGAASDIAWTGMVRLEPGFYMQADLAGTWDMHSIRLQTGDHRWFHARLTIDAAGNTTGWVTDSTGGSEFIAGTFTLSTSGIVTTSISPEWIGGLCSDRNVIFGTQDDTGLSRIDVLVRLTPPDDISRLRGRYLDYGVSADPPPKWSRAQIRVGSHGNYAAKEWDSLGNTGTSAGTMAFRHDGTLRITSALNWAGVADPSRTLFTGHDNHNSSIAFGVFLKQPRAAFRILSFARYVDPFSGQPAFRLRWTSSEIESYDVEYTWDPPGPAEVWSELAGAIPGAAEFTELAFGAMPTRPRARFRVAVREP